MSASACPGPTGGSWSTSPTSSRPASAGSDSTRASISGMSTIEVSSTTRRSQSMRFSRPREKAPNSGSISSRRWIVFASMPVCSVMRLAARPVGAASVTETSWRVSSLRMVSSSVVLPTPGPPVITETLAARMVASASRCDGASAFPVRASTRGTSLARSILPQGGAPLARSRSRSPMIVSARCRSFRKRCGSPPMVSATRLRAATSASAACSIGPTSPSRRRAASATASSRGSPVWPSSRAS